MLLVMAVKRLFEMRDSTVATAAAGVTSCS
jgi:hypothetical protein